MNSVFPDNTPSVDSSLSPLMGDSLATLGIAFEPTIGSRSLVSRRSTQQLLSQNATGPLKLKLKGKGERVVGTAANDSLDASKGKGKNTLLGKQGNDRLKGKKNDKLIGGPGNDRLDTRNGRKNTLKGGGGNDTLFAGKKDKVLGGGGADTLNALKGNGNNVLKGGGGNDVLIGMKGDRLVGGGGVDEFVLVKGKLPQKALIVQDFKQGSDRLSIENYSGATVFSDLTLTQQNTDTLIEIQGQSVAILENVTATQLTSDDINGIAPSPSPSPGTSTPSPATPSPTTPSPTTPSPTPIQVSVSDDEVFEGNPGDNNQASFVVSLSRPADQAVTVTYQTVSVANGATPNTDYQPTQGTLTIPKGATSRSIDVPIIEDLEDENDERFDLELLSASGASISDSRAIGLIKDDEDDAIGSQQSNTYSITSLDAQSINTQFEFSNLDGDGNVIPDSNPDSLVGLFEGAIANYRSGSGKLPFGVDPEPFEPNGNVEYSIVDLRARFISSSAQDPDEFGDRDTIEYAFIAPDDQVFRTFRLDFGGPLLNFPSTFNQNEAVHSITHILENDLLNFMVEIDIDGGFISGGSTTTQQGKTYSKVRSANGTESLVSLFTLLSENPETYEIINDDEASLVQGAFANAIANYANTDLNISFTQGTLTVERTGDVVEYTITSADSSESVAASLDLASTSLDSNLAVNDIQYILDNDVLRLAFFPD